MNIVLGIISVFITFFLTVLAEKLFKKEGLYVWASIATIIANIIICKGIDLLSFKVNLGNVLFASSFLATDIMNEKYGAEESKKAIVIAVFSQIVFLISTQIALQYTPNDIDIANESMKTLFSINLRISISSIFMYLASNMFDVYLYEKLRMKFPSKLWLRNNVSTMISNSLENYMFSFMAFTGIYNIKSIIEIATVASLLEIIIAAMDTPFLYLSKLKYKKENSNLKKTLTKFKKTNII